jgi:aldose sugar dehydrogenase
MRRRLLALALVAATTVALQPVEPASAVGRARVVRCKKPRACWITAFAFTPAGDELFYAERYSGEIRHVNLATGADTRWTRIRGVAGVGEQGLLGIAVDPQWETGEERVFAYYTQRKPERNRIVRLSKENGKVQRAFLATIPATTFHDGGVIHFGPDGKLYAVTGDAGVPSRSQRVRNPAGKVLRMEESGARPSDNPFANGKAYSIGHRNSFGFAFDPVTGRLWQSENGPTCDDEINMVLPGRNYGWGGGSACPRTSESGPNPVQPEVRINPMTAPTGVAFCAACGLGAEVDGDLLYGTYLSRKIHALDLNADRDGVTGRRVILSHPRAVLAVEAAPGGAVYFSDLRAIYRLV